MTNTLDALRRAGNHLANCAQNLAQEQMLSQRIRDVLRECYQDWDSAVAAARTAAPHPIGQQAEPFGWLYETAAGTRMFHKAGDCSEQMLRVDMESARLYPTGHKVTALYIAPAAQGEGDRNGR